MTAAAYIGYLSSRVDARGVLNEKTFEPLPMSGAVVDVTTHWYFARVSVRLEFRNLSADVIKTFAALDQPTSVGGHIASLRAEVGKHFMQTRVSEGFTDVKTTAQSAPPKAVTFDVPWLVHGGSSVVLTAVYMLPLSAIGSSKSVLTIPQCLIPKTPLEENVDGSAGETWSTKFAIKAEPRLPQTVLIHGRGTLFAAVDGTAKANIPGAAVTRLGDPRRFELRYENRDKIDQLPKDFEVVAPLIADEDPLVLQAAKEDAPFVDDAHRYAMAMAVTPKLGAREECVDPNVELSILCDCSGSMRPYEGVVSDAVRGLIASLPDSAFVNVMRFGETQEWALEESAPLDQATADQLATFPLCADMGATKLYRAIGEAYMKPVVQGHARLIVVVSDGTESVNGQKLLELAAANVHSTRVIAVTLGDFADQALFAKLAAVTRGHHVHCADAANLPTVLAEATGPALTKYLTGVAVEFSYDGVDEKPPLQLTVDHPPMIAAGSREILYAFGDATLRGCTVKVGGLVGSEYKEMKAFSGAVDKFDVNSATDGDLSTTSLVHVAAAASRIDTLVNFNAKAALSDVERVEVTRLSTAFYVPSPYTKLQCRSGEQNADTFDPKAKLVNAPFVERRAHYLLPPAKKPCGPNGKAVDADEYGVTLAAASVDNRCPPGATATEYLKSIVTQCADQVVKNARIDDVIKGQQRGGFWLAAKAYPALDLFGIRFADVESSMPEELVPKPPSPPPKPETPVAEAAPAEEAADAAPAATSSAPSSPAEAPPAKGSKADAKAEPASPKTGKQAADSKAEPASSKTGKQAAESKAEPASPKTGKQQAAEAKAATPVDAAPAAETAAADEADAKAAEEETAAAPEPAAPTPPPYNGAHPMDLWVTAVLYTALANSSTYARHPRTKLTSLRAKDYLDHVGAAGAVALQKARSVAVAPA